MENLQNLKFLASEINFLGKKYILFNYSDSAKALGQQLVFEELHLYYHDDYDDFQYDLIKDKNLEGFIDTVCNLRGEQDPLTKSLTRLRSDLFNIIENDDFEVLKAFINKFNDELKSIENGARYIFFENINDAYEYVKKNWKEDAVLELALFDEPITKEK